MYYEDRGEGTAFVFLHGNPTSSPLWRHVLPRIEGPVRVPAPDLIGMGRSGKPGGEYAFADHARYLDAWFDAAGLDEVVLVGQDWGGALAFDRAARHPGRVRGIAFMETIVRPKGWVPKLLLTFDGSPALMVGAEAAAWCERNISALESEYCGAAAHLCPEDRPEEIAAAVNAWAARHALAG
ncbi:alpha/beta fold hydrolase [Streptomyces sp. NRRL S-378]|uniref:alpha/beta fold hydrolase n=1 Tax=Streptomyces sp. NRRL S-378 TaxID=1463904 RepID=UPI0004C7DE6B|nr:alpha/beta fold hydrolase [Streptomyces sp. NRRL S-378]